MKKWVVEDFNTADYVPLEYRLNELEKSGRKIKEIIFLGQVMHGHMYQIIYTEEDIFEVNN